MVEDEAAADGARASVRIALKVVPGSRRDQIVGPYGDRLKVKVAAPPEDGRANEAVCGVLAEALGVSVRDVRVISGQRNAEKVVRVMGVRAADVLRRLGIT